jgi:glycosyltransferase involved in cell wall biosynthesis
MKLSLCITSFNRVDLTLESFSKVYDHPMIDEIVIVDDASDLYLFTQLFNAVAGMKKVKLFRNQENLGMSRNKAEAISKAKNEWCILFDSDNILYPEYLEAIPASLLSDTIYCPGVAEPDYKFTGIKKEINKRNAKDFLGMKEFRVFLNAGNYVVNRDEYLRVYKYDPAIKESDTIHFAHLWLESGNSFYIVPEMRYYHRKHSGSGWKMGNRQYNLKKADEIQNKIKQL